MKKNYTLTFFILLLVFGSCSDAIVNKELYKTKTKYSSKISNLKGRVGIEKVELNWDNPDDQVAKKIRIEYGDDLFIETDTLVSTYTINLGFGGNIEFVVYTLDTYGNKSVGTSIFLTPFSSTVVESFVESVTTVKPTSHVEEDNLIIRWKNLTSNNFLRYTGKLDYTYKINNVRYTGFANSNNINEEWVYIPNISSPAIIDFEYTMYYYPIINNIIIMDTISKTERMTITVEYPNDGLLEKIDNSRCIQLTSIPFDNTTKHNSSYDFYNLFDNNSQTIWITSSPDSPGTDGVNAGNAQNGEKYPVSFTIDLSKSLTLLQMEYVGWENFSQGPKRFEIWGTDYISEEKQDSYWSTIEPGEWQNDWFKLGDCEASTIPQSPSVVFPINPERKQSRFIRVVIHEVFNPLPSIIRIAMGELIFYKNPELITKISY